MDEYEIPPFHYDGTMFVSDISSLKVDPLQVKVEAGEYTMKPYLDGFIYTKTTYEPEFKDIVKVLNTRDGDPGLSGTYHGGFTKDDAIISLINNHFMSYVYDERYLNEYYCDYDDLEEEEEEDIEDENDKDYVAEDCEEDDTDEEDETMELDETEDSDGVENGCEKELKDDCDDKNKENNEEETKDNEEIEDNTDSEEEETIDEEKINWLEFLLSEYDDKKEEEEERRIDTSDPYSYRHNPKPKRVTQLPDYNNLPILFFLNTKPVVEDMLLEKVYDKENTIVVWNVIDCNRGKIGVAIGLKEFHCMNE